MAITQIAWNRFGLGYKAGDQVPANPRKWLLDQLEHYDPAPAAIAALPRSPQLVAEFAEIRAEKKDEKQQRSAAPVETAGIRPCTELKAKDLLEK